MKQTFKANTFRANTFASGNWQGLGVTVVGGLVCATVSLTPRVNGSVAIAPRVTATAGLEVC